jgi:ectoine hydroxylase-related dioxygenase (phytanoyl-CoA dioxygenase family)
VLVDATGGWPTEAAERFRTDGACVVRDALTRDQVEHIRAAVDALGERDELADLSAIVGTDEAPRFRGGVDHWRTDPVFAALATTGPLPAIAAAVLGTRRLWLYEDSVLVKEPGSTVATRWHTDDGYFHVEGWAMATLWVPLDPAPREAGSLHFRRRSHTSDHRYQPTLFVTDDPIPGTQGQPPPQPELSDPDVVCFDLEVGDLTIHHARTLHAAQGNATELPRRALSVRYCGDDTVVRVKPGAPGKPGFDDIAPGTPLADVADTLGLMEAVLGP